MGPQGTWKFGTCYFPICLSSCSLQEIRGCSNGTAAWVIANCAHLFHFSVSEVAEVREPACCFRYFYWWKMVEVRKCHKPVCPWGCQLPHTALSQGLCRVDVDLNLDGVTAWVAALELQRRQLGAVSPEHLTLCSFSSYSCRCICVFFFFFLLEIQRAANGFVRWLQDWKLMLHSASSTWGFLFVCFYVKLQEFGKKKDRK